jgi:hypothetical protein
MTAAALTLAALLAIAAVLYVARPFLVRLREGGVSRDGGEADELGRLALLEQRDRALAALKELEFDHRTGKISDEDYRSLVGPLRAEAAGTLAALAAAEQRADDGSPAEPSRAPTPPRPEG